MRAVRLTYTWVRYSAHLWNPPKLGRRLSIWERISNLKYAVDSRGGKKKHRSHPKKEKKKQVFCRSLIWDLVGGLAKRDGNYQF